MLFAAIFYVATGVGGCEWPISARDIHMDVFFWKFSNNPPNSSFMADSMTFLITLYSTCTVPFSRSIACISVLNFGLGRNTYLI